MNEKRTLLVVDDQEINRKMLGSILQEEYALLFAENGERAMEELRKHRLQITLVLLDIVMPVMDGYAVLEAMQQDPQLSAIPVLVMTQKEGDYDELRAFAMGACDFITKPYHPEIVRHRIAKTIRLLESYDLLQRAEERAQTDPLTGLQNRSGLEQAVSGFFARHPAGEAALLMLDIDNFKNVNDLYGHAEGDRVLIEIGCALGTCFRSGDTLARLGGDEFAAFLPFALSVEQLTKRLEAICAKVASLDLKYRVSCTIGACQAPAFGQDYQILYEHADQSMLTAKRMGKNQYRIYNGETDHPMPMQLRSMEWLLDEIKEAILITDRKTRSILYLNRPAALIAGKEKRACLGTRCYETIWGRSTPCSFCVSPEQVGSGLHTCETCPPNTGKIYRVNTQMIQWDEKPARLQYIWDMTQEIAAQQRFHTILSSLRTALVKCEAGATMRLLDANAAFYELVGYTKAEFDRECKNNLESVLSSTGKAELLKHCGKVQNGETGFTLETELHAKNGRWIPVIEDVFILQEDGQYDCYHTFTDVSRTDKLWIAHPPEK